MEKDTDTSMLVSRMCEVKVVHTACVHVHSTRKAIRSSAFLKFSSSHHEKWKAIGDIVRCISL